MSYANATRLKMLKDEVAKYESGDLGLSQGEQQAYTDSANAQLNAGANAQTQAISQDALAAGPQASGRYAALQRSLAGDVAQGYAANSADTTRTNEALKESQATRISGDVERQQQLSAQKAQYWGKILLGTAETAGGVVATAYGQGEIGAPLISAGIGTITGAKK